MINASARPYADVSVAAVEAEFDRRFAAAVATGAYDPYLDMSLVVWSASLHPWLETTAGQHYGPIAIQDGDVTYYSIIIHVPNTQILVEVVSPERPSATTVYTDALRRLRVADACVRNQCAEKDPGVWVPLAVSRGVSNLTEMRARRARDSPSGRGVAATPFPPPRRHGFYSDVMNASVAHSDSAEGASLKTYALPKGGAVEKDLGMQIRLIERPASADGLSIADLEKAKLSAKARTQGRSEAESALCGVDKWYDNHWG